MKPAIRLQIACDGRLIAEVIGEFEMFSAFQRGGGVWERFARAKALAGKPCGGSVLQRADLPRVWDVPVGSLIDPRDVPEPAREAVSV